jgi:hypothetical protein
LPSLQVVFILPPTGQGTFIINAQALNRSKPIRHNQWANYDVWRVSVSDVYDMAGPGHSFAFPPVRQEMLLDPTVGGGCLTELTYTFALSLRPARKVAYDTIQEFDDYFLKLWLYFADYNTTSTDHVIMDPAVFHNTYVLSPVRHEAIVRVPRSYPLESNSLLPSTWPLANGYDRSLTLQRPCKHADLENIGRGWYTNEPTEGFPSTRMSWRTSACAFYTPDRATLRRNLAGRWIAFSGDSTGEELAIIFLLRAGVVFNQSFKFENCPGHALGGARMYDTGRLKELDGGRVSFFWTSNINSCDNWMGLRTFDYPEFLAKLEFRLTNGGVPDVFVFNSGAHDLNNPISEYTFQLNNTLTLFRRILGPNCLIVWKTTNFPIRNNWQPAIDERNAQAMQVVQAHKAFGPVTFYDAFAMGMLSIQFDGANDRIHCSNILHDFNDNNTVYEPCAASLGAVSLALEEPV